MNSCFVESKDGKKMDEVVLQDKSSYSMFGKLGFTMIAAPIGCSTCQFEGETQWQVTDLLITV